MQKRLILAALAASGGLLTTALLHTAAAVAAPGDDAFTIGSYVFDPQLAAGGEGFDPVSQLVTSPPLLEIGGGSAIGIPLAPQSFDVYSANGASELGSIDTNETVTNLLGFTNAAFTVTGVSSDSATLPAVGTVYDAFNLGNGYENIYVATPGDNGTVTDVLITPTGQSIDLSSLFTFNAANPLDPGDAFTGLELGNVSGAAGAFQIGGFDLNPLLTDQLSGMPSGGDGFNTIAPLETIAPLLTIGGGSLNDPAVGGSLAIQDFEVLNSAGTGIGTVQAGVDVTNLLGFTNTELVVNSFSEVGPGLPTQGTLLDAFNLGNGYTNVYTATPDVTTDGVTTPGTVTDTLVTPYGNINLDGLVSSFNAANPLDPGDAVSGLHAGAGAIGADAFTIGGTTFDPTLGDTTTEGFNLVPQLFAAPPLLDLGGGTPTIFGLTLSLSTQSFNVYDGTAAADQIGSITTSDQVSNLLGFTNTEFTVTGGSLLADAPAGAALPVDGSVYDVLNLGALQNIYTAIPGADGSAATITDTLVTPFGNVDLSDLFGGIDATAALNPGDAFTAGLEALTSASAEAGSSAASGIDLLGFLGL